MTISHPKATRRDWLGLFIIALPCGLYAMDLTVLNLALPAISRDLKPTGTQLLWIIDTYGFMVAGSLMTMGTLGDRIGRRRLLLIGAIVFAAASVLAAFSRSAVMLIASRAILGVAGATVAPSTLSLIRNMFYDASERTRAISFWITSYSVGGAIGPLLGGLLLTRFWWGSVFLLSLPVMVTLLWFGPKLLPEFRDPEAGPLDLWSAFLSLASILPIIYGIKRGATEGPSGIVGLSIGIGLMVGFIFIRRQRKLAYPFIDLKLFSQKSFSAALAIYLLATMVAFGLYLFISQYLQLVLGLTPFLAGLWTLPSMVGFIVGSLFLPRLIKRWSTATLIIAGLFLAMIGFGLISQLGHLFGPPIIILGVGLYSLGLAPSFTLTTDFVVASAPPERAGAASAISEMSSELGGALGIAILGSIGTAVYRHQLIAHSAMVGLSETSFKTALETLGGAIDVAQTLPAAPQRALMHAAQDAFVVALRSTTVCCVVLTFMTAIPAFLFLRREGR